MNRLIQASMIGLALLLAACGGGDDNATANAAAGPESLQRIPAPSNGDWTEVVAQTGEGFLMGNPDARVKLVEYASITCPHCAEFAEQGGARLREYVRTGQVSWEYRPFMIFPTDPGIFMLLRCQGAAPFFHVSDQLYASQEEWMGRIRSLPQDQLAQTESMSPQQRAVFLVRAGGLDQFFRQRGMPEAQVNQCLADPRGLQQLLAISDRATREERVTATPSFLINGERAIGADRWSQLEPRLQAALQR